jgi:hypothetical protein
MIIIKKSGKKSSLILKDSSVFEGFILRTNLNIRYYYD